MISQANGISVRRSERSGRGVFADRHFSPGEVIEKCPVIVIPSSQLDFIYETVLGDYVYPWEMDVEHAAVPLGFGCIYNHSYDPNADWVQNTDELTQYYVALRDIDAGEEITVNYNGPPDDHTPVWFEMAGS